MLSQLDHPGIVPLLSQGLTDDGYCWLAMRWINGPSLRELLKSGPVSAVRAANWILQAGDALAFAHAHGVLHQDLKPDNILIGNPGRPDESVVLIDSEAGDVYSFAVVFFEVLTGVRYVSVAAGSAEALARTLSGYSESVARLLPKPWRSLRKLVART